MMEPDTHKSRPVRVRVDEVLFKDSSDRSARNAAPLDHEPSAQQHAADAAGADRFPRSATMRLILKHPALALGLGVPAAGLLLASPTSRRLVGMAVRIGTGPELQQLIRLTAGRSSSAVAAAPAPRDEPLR
jgi:hypothetical protein